MRHWRGLVLSGALVAATAGAYVLPGAAIVRHMAEAREELHLSGLRVEGTASFMGPAGVEAAQALGVGDRRDVQADTVLLMKMPGRCRMDLSVPEGGRLALFQGGKRHPEAGTLAPASLALREICGLLAVRSSSEASSAHALSRHLAALGVEVGQSSLGRADRQSLVYFLGSASGEKAGLAVLKGSFLPAQVRLGKGEWGGWEVRFLDYGSAATGDWFPRIVEVLKGGELAMRLTALKAEPRANLPDSSF